MLRDNKKPQTSVAVILILMFLFADLALPSAIPEWKELENTPTINRVISNVSPSADTYIDSFYPNDNFEQAQNGTLEGGLTSPARLLFSFNMSFGSTDTIHSATLNLKCWSDAVGSKDIAVYSAGLISSWNSTEVTWLNSATNVMWNSPGADGSTERSDWEPPHRTAANGTLSINVTALAQDAASSNQNTLELLIASEGAEYACAMNDSTTTTDRPSLILDTSSSAAGNGGSVAADFVEEGAPLMTGDFLLMAEKNPTLSYNSLVGDGVEFQLSLDPSFKAASDLPWHYSTMTNSFATSSGSGTFSIPNGDEISNGSVVYYRIRSMDSTDTLSDWNESYFLLPALSVTDNGDGTATITVDADDMGLNDDFIEDAQVDQRSINTKFGSNDKMEVMMSTNKESLVHMRLNLDQLGLHSNATIQSANLNLSRFSTTGSPELSIHEVNTEGVWDEDDTTWRRSDSSTLWDDGGRGLLSVASDTMAGTSSLTDTSFDIASAIQGWIRDGASGSKDFMLIGRSDTGAYSSSGLQGINFYSSESTNNALTPRFEFTYSWSSNTSIGTPTLTGPDQGKAVWDKVGHNLSGNSTPSLTWSGASSYDVIYEIATDQFFRERVNLLDTRTDSNFTSMQGVFNLTGDDELNTGNMYFWRMSHVDNDGLRGQWVTSNFLVSGLSSTWLGDDRYEFRLRDGNGTTDGLYPECDDTYIDSGSSTTNYDGETEMQISYNTWPSETSVLFNCDLVANLLPSGYAVESAHLTVKLADYPSGSPNVAVWESRQHNWTASGATWATYDGVNNWGSAGAKGWERGSLIDSLTIGSSYSAGDIIDWNVTLGVQNAMREDRAVDFLIGVTGVGTGSDRDIMIYPGSTNTETYRPQLSFVYVPGSDAIPNDPVLTTPLNGSWSVTDDIETAPIHRPELGWSFNGAMSIGGWAVQMDKSTSFSTPDLVMTTSWLDSGFDTTNLTYTPASNLDNGTTWYWRVRAISTTNQLGNWSQTYNFLLPDIATFSINSESASMELRHRKAMPQLNLPDFTDTYVIENGLGSSSTYDSSGYINVGEMPNGYQSAGLIKIPLNQLPTPSNARITNADLNLYSIFGSAIDEPIAIRPVLQNWNSDANDTTYDGVNNWSALGGRHIGTDIGNNVDIQDSVSADWMTWDVTEAIQAAQAAGSSELSLMIYTSGTVTQDLVQFISTDSTSSDKPWLNLTWSNGSATIPTVAGSNVGPSHNGITWNLTSHAPIPEYKPILSWTHANAANIDDWRLFIMADANEEMEGLTTYDSRTQPQLFDLTNLTFTPGMDIDHTREVRWMVQPVVDEMLGPRSASTVFHIPEEMGGEVDSTTAWVTIQEGAYVDPLSYPTVTEDVYVDSGNRFTNFGNSTTMYVGRSPLSSTHYANSLISFDLGVIPLPSVYEVQNATLEMSVVSSMGSGSVFTSVSVMNTNWNESSTWNSPSNSTNWLVQGAHHSGDSDLPFTEGQWINSSGGTVVWNLTAAIQAAIYNGQSSISLVIQGESFGTNTMGVYALHSSEASMISQRPRINFTYVEQAPWIPSAATGLLPADGTTLWNTSTPRPSGLTEFDANWTEHQNNETSWIACHSDSPRMVYSECIDMLELPAHNLTFNSTTNTMSVTNNSDNDEWTYWRVRAYQDNRVGEWSDVHSFRTPGNIGYDDGDGNHTVILSRGSIFSESGLVPIVPDVELESTVTSNQGASTVLDLGTTSSGTGESQILLEFYLGDIPWPAAMTPTSMVLKLWRQQVVGSTSTTVSAHACSSFSESTATWSNAPTCSTSELTRTTLTLMPPNGWHEFDLTSLAQSNIANGNTTMTILLKVVGTPSTTHRFFSSDYTANESRRPQLVLDYVDNTAGIVPPGQPSLVFPLDGSVLYDDSEVVLQSQTSPTLSWNPVTGASGYIVTIANATGVYKYKSWESTYINGTTFRFNNILDAGDVFSWWVQGVNQTIPGPSSARWSFAIGDPSHTDNQDLTFTYDFQTGNEVLQFGHTNIRDSTLSEANPEINNGDVDYLSLGTGCDSVTNAKCRVIIGLDNSQIPFAPFQNIHSASLGFYIYSMSASGGASTLDISVHRMLSSSWSQSASSWNQSTPGTNWSTPGLQAGVEYDATAISTMTLPSTATGWFWLDIGVNGMLIDNDNQWVLIATPNAGDLTIDMYSSEYSTPSYRPKIQLNTTNVSSVAISPTAPTTDADTTFSFSHQAYNHQALQLIAPVTWSSSDGSIDSFGLFTPRNAGTHTITACFGLICSSESITVTPGSPTTLDVTPLTGQITSDESLEITASVVDQFGNIVAGELITYSASNGTMGGVNGNIFYPFASGAQTVTVTWGTQSVDVQIAVDTGAPSHFELTGCEGVVPAGEWCDITHTLFDQYGNVLNSTEAGLLSWTTNNGNYSEINEQYFPDHLGTWTLTLTSVSGASAEINITVGHGEMQSLELATSSTSITADERVYINTTRIDVRGNRMTVVLPIENWTKIADGQLSAGAPAVWDPVTRGAKILEARYEFITAEVTITVSEGEINTLVLIVDSEDSSWQMMPLTADDTLAVKVKAIDAKGNRWTVTANWSISHALWNDQGVLEQIESDQTTFVPYHASTTPYTITATYDDGNMVHEISINATVSHGELTNIVLSSISSEDDTGLAAYDLTADDWIDFAADLSDEDQNPIDSSILKWILTDESNGEETDITNDIQTIGRWQAEKVGNYSIRAFNISESGYPIGDTVSIIVHHGQAVSLHASEDANTATAGYQITIAITGTDSDGNTFPQNVEWQENDAVAHDINSTTDEGIYTYQARIEGPHLLTFSSSLTVSNEIELAVSAKRIVAHLKVELSLEEVEQLGEFMVNVTAYDEYWNKIPVPSSTLVDSTGRAQVLSQGDGVWRIITLDEGTQTITVNSGQVNEERTFTVTGTLQGFFEAGGILYYIGAFLAAAIAIVLLFVLKMVLSGNDDEWDEDEDEDDDDDDEPITERRKPTRGGGAGPTGPAGPAGPAPTPKPVPEIEPEETDFTKDESYRVDDEGTEWWEDDSGTWWYRLPGEDDWEEWTD